MKEDTKAAFHKLALAITDSLELMWNETKEEHKAMNVAVEELLKKIIALESKLKTTWTNIASVAHHLPVVTVCNLRSPFPKIGNFKTDLFEHQVDVRLCCEVWEKAENKKHKDEIELMVELDGLQYLSTTRPHWKRGGGAAIIVNTERFKVEKL